MILSQNRFFVNVFSEKKGILINMPAYKDTERNTWYAAFNVKDWNGKIIRKKKRGFKTKKEALEWEAKIKLQKDQVSNLTLDQLFDKYLEVNQKDIQNTTLNMKHRNYRNHIKNILGNIKIEKITPQMVLDWENTLTNKSRSKKELKSSTIKNCRALLAAILNFGIKFYGLQKNPVQRNTKQKRVSIPIHKFWTFDDFSKFINSPALSEKAKIYFEVLYWTGMRWGELHALTIKDINLKEKTILISKTNPGAAWGIHKTKTEAGNRKVSIPDFLVEKIQKHLDSLLLTEDMLVFSLNSSGIRRYMEIACKAENLTYVGLHGIRHSHASLLFNMGYTPLMIKERLGHQDIQTTLGVYTHIFKEQDASLVASLEALGRGDKEKIRGKSILYPLICTCINNLISCHFPNFPQIPSFEATSLQEVVSIGKTVLLQYLLNTEGAQNVKPFMPGEITTGDTDVILYISGTVQISLK